jgi:hypothetical protein
MHDLFGSSILSLLGVAFPQQPLLSAPHDWTIHHAPKNIQISRHIPKQSKKVNKKYKINSF